MDVHAPRLDPRLLDALVVLVVASAGLFGLFGPVLLSDAELSPVLVPALALALFQAVVLWWRRTTPLLVLSATLLAVVVAQSIGDVNAASYFGPLAAAYGLGAYGERSHAIRGLVVVALAVAADAAVVRWVAEESGYGAVLLSPTGGAVVVAWGIGTYMAVRRAYVAAVVDHARRLEAEQDERARRAVLDERRRIARELHDQVAHHLGVVSLQTAAARRWLSRDTERSATALESAERASRTALETMPVILDALRSEDRAIDDAALAPQPDLDDIERLVADVNATGLRAELRVTGDRRLVNPAVGLAAYRIVQEALTNTMKYAGDASAVVHLHYSADRLEVEVTDDGYGLAAHVKNGSRFGLVGMRERVELLGGDLRAGPQEGGGFEVRASLPRIAEEVPS